MAQAAQQAKTFGTQVIRVLKSGLLTTTGLALVGTGCYVAYKDTRRFPRMIETFESGNILTPLASNKHEPEYFHRLDLEKRLTQVLEPTFANEYFLVKGELGSGKSRLVLELVREMIKTSGKNKEGAPIYVLASQGRAFPDNLAEAVNFLFDEHLNFKYFLDFVLKVHSKPSGDTDQQLSRVLEAIEQAAYKYSQKRGKPVVIVIDGVNYIAQHHPSALERLAEKAKLWSDSNIVKLVLITNDEKTEEILRANQSSWLRTDAPVYIGDLGPGDAFQLLMDPTCMETEGVHTCHEILDEKQAYKVIDTVGGRLQHLLVVKQSIHDGIPLDTILTRLKQKEQEKFLEVTKSATAIKAVAELNKITNRCMPVARFLTICSRQDLDHLTYLNVIKYSQKDGDLCVCFDSLLMENVVKALLK